MSGVVFFFFLKNSIFVSFLFWFFTFFSKSLFTNRYFNFKLNFYECGFKNINKGKINYNINYLMLLLLVILYDSEFLVFLPYSLNTPVHSLEAFLCFFFFLVWFLFSLIFDFFLNSFDWQV